MEKKQRGFTMVELVIVLVLMTILGAAVVPNMAIIYKQQIQKTAHTLSIDLATLREQARANGKTYYLQLDAMGQHYTMGNDSNAVAALHRQDADNGKNIKITMMANGTAISKLIFIGEKMQIDGGTEITECQFKIEYSGYTDYGEATFDNESGRYSFQMNP